MTLTREEFEKRMQFSGESEEKLKENLEQDISGIKKTILDPNDPMAQKEYTFKLDYTDRLGKKWEGNFTTKILSIRERQLTGALRARMSGGAAIESLDALTNELNLILAHLVYSLVVKPGWADDLSSLEDVGIVQAIYSEVAAHEARFLGW